MDFGFWILDFGLHGCCPSSAAIHPAPRPFPSDARCPRAFRIRIPKSKIQNPKWIAAVALLLLCGCPPTNDSGPSRSFFGNNNSAEPAAEKEGLQILCAEFSGPDRMRTADDLSASLKRVPGLLPGRVSIVHETDRSVVTYGPYPPAYRPQGGFDITPEIRRDMNLIRSLAINEQFPFLTAAIRPSPTPDPGPPEWNLRNAPGVYSLQIGIFFNAGRFLERKQAAVEWVRDLRQRGFPAFYHHDNAKGRSIVTVGAFDESAVIAGRGVARNRRERDYSPSPRDYSQEVIELQHNSSEFRYNHENGAEVKANGIPQASFLVSIPHASRDELVP